MTLTSSWHILYIEGWSSTNVLSVTATYQGPDTGNVPIVIPAFHNPLGSSSSAVGRYLECNPTGLISGDRNFTMCAYNVKFSYNIGNLAQLYTYYTQVSFDQSSIVLF